MPTLPVIFLGSSNKTRELTRLLAEKLTATGDVEVLPWYEAFDPGFAALEDLAKRLGEVDFAGFLLMADDQLQARDETQAVPRDNVIFELGLFMGKLNRERTFAFVEEPRKGRRQVKLPSDFSGVTQIRYAPGDAAELAAKVVAKIRSLGRLQSAPAGTHVVEPNAVGRDVYGTISAAVQAASKCDVILVRPGVYTETLVIDKPLEIIGVGGIDDKSDRAIVRAKDATAISYEAPQGHGRIATLCIEGGGDGKCGLDVVEGRLTIRGCTVSGLSPLEACVRIRGNGHATLRANRIKSSEGVGVLVCENGDAQIVANRIADHAHSCIEVRDRTAPEIRANRIENGAAGGIWVHGAGKGEIEGNEIFGHVQAGVSITDKANPALTGNRIYKCKGAGVHISALGRGRIEDNDIHSNGGSGIEVKSGGEPVIQGNRVYDGLGGGIACEDGARGHIEENHIRTNHRAGVAFRADCGPITFRGNTVIDGLAEGVYDELGVPENGNDVDRNDKGDWRGPAVAVV